ncbi:MAG: hypothetical protein IKV82_02225 [Akkermansia sp.]|nr:hypothetical protein [Akkermansia sp.]
MRIKFDEPVVQRSEVYDDEPTGFTVTGDADHQPTCEWTDQDKLDISFKRGTSVQTTFRLSFVPGQDRYLGGGKIEPGDIEFRVPDAVLQASQLEGTPTATFCVYPGSYISKEAIEFSPSSPVRYEFREVKTDDDEVEGFGKTIPALAQPATLKQIPRSDLALQALTDAKVDWKTVNGDTVVPGFVIVQAPQGLDEDKIWDLHIVPAEGSGLCTNEKAAKHVWGLNAFTPETELGTGLIQYMTRPDAEETATGKKREMRLKVKFSAPVRTSDLPELFGKITIRCGDHTATNNADGSKQLSIGGKNTTFRLIQDEQESTHESPTVRIGESEHNLRVSFKTAPTTETMVLALDDMEPGDLELIIPQDTAAANGLATACDHLHRISINPAYPQVDSSVRNIPAKGDHHFRIHTTNDESVELKAWYMGAEQILQFINAPRDVMEQKASTLNRLKYRLAVEEKRLDEVPNASKHMADTIRRSIPATERKTRTQAQRREAFLQGLPSFAPQNMTVPAAGDSALLCTQELAINLDTLTGGPAKPGIYIISMKPKAAPGARKQAAAVGQDAALLEDESYAILWVSDLICSTDDGMSIITRLSDGSLVKEAEIYAADGSKSSITRGLYLHPRQSNNPRGVVAIAGDDFTLMDSSSRPRHRNDDELRHNIFADRPLYRPGDTVNLRGILRLSHAQGDSSLSPMTKWVQLTIRKPNGEVLKKHDITPDDFGAWTYSFTLPEGEEDITGDYTVRAGIPGNSEATETIGINCQVFRRDAFEADLTLKADNIAPRSFTATVHATDLNGTPLSGATVTLKLESSYKALTLSPDDKPASYIEKTLKTDAAGKLTLQGQMAPMPDSEAGSAFIRIKGSVANDRQEYKKLESIHHTLYAADFMPRLDNTRLRLLKVPTQKDAPLDREQQVRVRIMAEATQHEQLPGGICLSRTKDECFYDKTHTIPAGSKNGIDLPLKDIIKSPDVSDNPVVLVEGTDTAGRKLSARLPWHSWRNSHIPDTPESQLNATAEANSLKLELAAAREGEALVFLHSRQGSRVEPMTVRQGKQTLTIPLQQGEDGTLRCELHQTIPNETGLYTRWTRAESECRKERPDMKLDVCMDALPDTAAPGSELTFSGRVTLPDGSPAEAEVTLYAVDEGMLSVAPYTLPDLAEYFGKVSLPNLQFSPMLFSDKEAHTSPALTLMPAVWEGDIVGNGRYVPLITNVRKVRDAGAVPMAMGGSNSYRARAVASVDAHWAEEEAEDEGGMEMAAAPVAPVVVMQRALEDEEEEGDEGTAAPRLRTNFAPIAVWQGALRTDAEGKFSTQVKLPDTLTTWQIFAVAIDKSGKRYGHREESITANLPVMITAGTPFFMSVGDSLQLPLTITNNTDKAGTWKVQLEGAATQSIALQAGSTGTLFFTIAPTQEGTTTLRWRATSPGGSDAVEGSFPVRYPAPVLKETHHLVQTTGQPALNIAALAAPELASSTRGSVVIELSANPLLHLASCMDFMLSYPYGCTEQTSTALLPWIYHSRLAPFTPTMEVVSPAQVNKIITESVEQLFRRQKEDGGLGYWGSSTESCLWASAHAAMVFTIAEENGYSMPAESMQKLRRYLTSRSSKEMKELSPLSRYAIGRACSKEGLISEALKEALNESAIQPRWRWCINNTIKEDIAFISALRENPGDRHNSFLRWLRTQAHDYRHRSTWQSAWMMVALGEYLKLENAAADTASVQLQDGQQLTLGNGITRLTPPISTHLALLPTTLTTTAGTAYMNVKFRALPEQTEYPGVTEKGMQVTRVYEVRDKEGRWHATTEFHVGDVVRVTLTCAKAAEELQYFVLEDYLPASMEAINPEVPGQAAGLEWQPWSSWFDHKEYLADRVRGFCTRWGDRSLLNMSYYARVKRAGTATAPPAQAQLMYEPQYYGLSPNTKVKSK